MNIDIIKVFVYCFIATYFYALLMNAPSKVLVRCSVIGTIGYVLYLMCKYYYSEILGFFLGTLVIAFLGEVSARKVKMPATIFIFPALIPIVPGLGLYETMLAFVRGFVQDGLEIGVRTISNIGAMALAMAIISFMVTIASSKAKKQNI